LRDPERFRSWLHGIVLNVARAAHRRQPPLNVPLVGDGMPADPYPSVDLRLLLHDAVRELSGGPRSAMVLFYLEDLSVADIAHRLAMSPGTVKSHLHEGRRRLHEQLSATNPELVPPLPPRRPKMINVRIGAVLAVAPRVLIILVDEAGRQALPLWLRPHEAHALMASIDVASSLLEATDSRISEVRINHLGEDAYAAEIHLDAPNGPRSVKARLADGLALARRAGSRILVDEADVARLGLPLPPDGRLEPVVEAASASAGLPPRVLTADPEREDQPRNMTFADGLRHWDLRGTFLRDMSGRHWRDYVAGVDEGSAFLRSSVDDPIGYADLRQGILADRYRGGRVALEADIRTGGVGGRAGLYLRVVDPDRSRSPEQRNQVSATSGPQWTRIRVEAEVPENAVYLLFGVNLAGPGEIWLSGPSLGTVS
jgi:bifunctional DNase/RNase